MIGLGLAPGATTDWRFPGVNFNNPNWMQPQQAQQPNTSPAPPPPPPQYPQQVPNQYIAPVWKPSVEATPQYAVSSAPWAQNPMTPTPAFQGAGTQSMSTMQPLNTNPGFNTPVRGYNALSLFDTLRQKFPGVGFGLEDQGNGPTITNWQGQSPKPDLNNLPFLPRY